MTTLGDRVKQIRQRLGMSQKEFGERIGVTAVTVSTTENGKTHPDAQTIKVICNEFRINNLWLELGVGDMEIPIQNAEIKSIFNQQTTEEIEAIQKWLNKPGARVLIANIAMLLEGSRAV